MKKYLNIIANVPYNANLHGVPRGQIESLIAHHSAEIHKGTQCRALLTSAQPAKHEKVAKIQRHDRGQHEDHEQRQMDQQRQESNHHRHDQIHFVQEIELFPEHRIFVRPITLHLVQQSTDILIANQTQIDTQYVGWSRPTF